MSLQMLQVARLAPNLLRESTGRVVEFLHTQLHPEGGFLDRSGKPDLYYTLFGIQCLLALQQEVSPESRGYLARFDDPQELDLVHLACLARCRIMLKEMPAALREALPARLKAHRTAEGGYAPQPGGARTTAYACFLACGAFQDLGEEIPEPQDLARALGDLAHPDGGFVNEKGPAGPTTPATASAVTVLHQLGAPIPPAAGTWLLARCHADGGFFASAQAPIPDVLSTAVALHALASMHCDFTPVRDPCLDFLDRLWSTKGSICPSYAEESLDVEYTWYGLLALGHLSL